MISSGEAAVIAAEAHDGQFDKAGAPYIAHPAMVAALAAAAGADDEIVAVAWLHDVIEDTAVTADILAGAGASTRQLAALAALTHTRSERRDVYIARIAGNGDATLVKRADIAANTDPARVAVLDEATRTRLAVKYGRDLAQLDELAV